MQVRAWDKTVGSSYETARALGGKFGRSEVLPIVPAALGPNPEGTLLYGLTSFQLQLGLPNFVTGHLDLLQTFEDGTLEWQLTGAAGFRYLIERKIDTAPWTPFQVIPNPTGTATFTDTPATETTVQIYRARIID